MQECERLLAHLVACELYHSCSAAQTNRGRSCSRSSVMVAHMHLRSCLVCRHWSCRSVLRRRCPVLRWNFLGSRFRTGTAGTGGRKQSRLQLLSLCSDAACLLRLTCRAAVNLPQPGARGPEQKFCWLVADVSGTIFSTNLSPHQHTVVRSTTGRRSAEWGPGSESKGCALACCLRRVSTSGVGGGGWMRVRG